MTRTVALIDYGSGNLRSAEKALARAAVESHSGHEIVVTDDPAVVAVAERIVLPGVGAFADCMKGLSSVPGMTAAQRNLVLLKQRGKPDADPKKPASPATGSGGQFPEAE